MSPDATYDDSDHPYDELPGLLAGELAPAEAAHVRRHLAGCDGCRRRLADVATVVGALSDAARLQLPDAVDLPPLVLTQRVPARRRRPRGLLAAAAAAVVTAGLGGWLVLPHGGRPTAVALRPLAGYRAAGTAQMAGHGDDQRMVVRVSGLAEQPGHFYEVWLLDPAHARALAVGVLPADGAGTYALPTSAVSGYQAVDISVEPADGNPAHSAVSVARGRL